MYTNGNAMYRFNSQSGEIPYNVKYNCYNVMTMFTY